MSREIKHHGEILEAIRNSGIISELVEKHGDHFTYELDLEVIAYGRSHVGKKVGPYARLLVFAPDEEIIRQGDWGGNTFYILVEGKLDVYVRTGVEENVRVGEIKAQNSFTSNHMSANQRIP